MLKKKKSIVVAIPCYNEEKFIGDIVAKSLKYADHVVVIDDGSTDKTAEIAEKAGAMVKRHGRQIGPGAAVRTCFEVSKELGCDILVTIDGDAQHDPDEIPAVIQPIIENNMDLVIGSRFLRHYSIKEYRKLGIDLLTWLFNFGRRDKLTDAQCCFRAHGKQLIDTIKITDSGFGYSIEVLEFARRHGSRIAEVPVSCIYHSESSTINPLIHGFQVACSVFRHRFKTR